MSEIIRASLSGSFHRDAVGLQRAYDELARNQCQILSPHRLNFEDNTTLFVRDVAERHQSADSLEAHHLLAISQSNFLWVHAPDGYIGLSAAMEVGYARALGIPVFASSQVEDQVLASLIVKVDSVFMAIQNLCSYPRS